MKPANKPAENPPTRKRGRPRKEKTSQPKRPRGRPRGLKPEALEILFEFILSPEMRSGGRFSRKRALRAAAARVKMPLPVSNEVLLPAFDTYEEAERAAIAARSAAPTRSLTPEEQRKLIDSVSRFLKASRSSAAKQTISPGEYQLCAGCGEVLSGGDPCEVRSVLDPEAGIPVKVYVHPKSKERPNCISAWHKSGDSQTLDRLDLAAQLTPQDGDEGDFYLARVDVPGVCTTVRGGGFENSKTRQKKLEKWIKGEALRLYPEGPDPDLFHRNEYGLDLTAQREANGGNTRMRASEGLSRIDGDPDEDEKTNDKLLPKSLRSVAIGKNHVEHAIVEDLSAEGKLDARITFSMRVEEAAAIGLKAREEKHAYGTEPPGRDLSGLISDDAAYFENWADGIWRRFWKDFLQIKREFQDRLINRKEKNQRIKEVRAERKEALKRAEEERKESERAGPRVKSSDDGMSAERFDPNAALPTGLRAEREEKVIGKGKFRSKFRGSYYERDVQDREGETPLYQNHRPYARRDGFAHVWRGTFSSFLLDRGSVLLGWPRKVESLTDEEIEQRKRARLEWKEYSKKVDRKSNKLGPEHPEWSAKCFEARWGAFRKLKAEERDLEKEPEPDSLSDSLSKRLPRRLAAKGCIIDSRNLGFGRVLAAYKKRKGMKLHFVGEQDRLYSFAEIGICDAFKPDKKKRLRDDEKLVNELAQVSKKLENAVTWWGWNPREAELKFTFSGKPRGDGFLFDKSAKNTLDKAAEFARAQWTHKEIQQYDPSMVYEIDGVTPVLGGQKPMSAKKFNARKAKEWVPPDDLFAFGARLALEERARFRISTRVRNLCLAKILIRRASMREVWSPWTYALLGGFPRTLHQGRPSRPMMTYKRCSFEGKTWFESYYPYWGETDRQLHAFGINSLTWRYLRDEHRKKVDWFDVIPLAERINGLSLDVRVSPIRHGPVCGTAAFRYVFPTDKPCRAAEMRSSWDTRCQWCPSPCVNGDTDFSGIIFTMLNKGEGEKAPLAA